MDAKLKAQTQKVVKGMLVFGVIGTVFLCLISMLFPKYDMLELVLGLWLGLLVAIANIVLIALNLEKSVDKGKKLQAGMSYYGGYIIRLVLAAAVLILAAKVEYFNLLSTALGLVSSQIVIFIGRLIKKI